MALTCVTVARRRHQMVLEEMAAAVRSGAGIIELRLDYLRSEPRFSDFLAKREVPLIATVRRRADGGQFQGSEEVRQRLLRSAIVAGFDYVDLEQDIADSIPRFGKTKRIVSFHDMEKMPDDLRELHRLMKAKDADIVKIAARANHITDNFELLDLVKNATVPTLGLAMGELGTASRVLGAKFGAPFTYAAMNPMRIPAPGMLTLAELQDLYGYDRINSETEIFGVIGDPVSQSLSPLVHNTCYRHLGLNKVYVPFRVAPESLDRFLREARRLPIAGLSVTIPHKQAIATLGEAGDSLVGATGSGNTLVFSKNRARVYNTDGAAAADSLEAAMAQATGDGSLKDRAVLLLGAGGVARSIAFSLQQRGAIVTVTNRTSDRAHALAHDAGCTFLEWSERHTRHFDIIINCTSLGMAPNYADTPFHAGSMHERMVVFDTVYNPETTTLIREARDRNCVAVTGVDMFVRQAEAQFLLFTGQTAPAGLMATLVREEFSPAKRMLREQRRTHEAAS